MGTLIRFLLFCICLALVALLHVLAPKEGQEVKLALVGAAMMVLKKLLAKP